MSAMGPDVQHRKLGRRWRGAGGCGGGGFTRNTDPMAMAGTQAQDPKFAIRPVYSTRAHGRLFD